MRYLQGYLKNTLHKHQVKKNISRLSYQDVFINFDAFKTNFVDSDLACFYALFYKFNYLIMFKGDSVKETYIVPDISMSEFIRKKQDTLKQFARYMVLQNALKFIGLDGIYKLSDKNRTKEVNKILNTLSVKLTPHTIELNIDRMLSKEEVDYQVTSRRMDKFDKNRTKQDNDAIKELVYIYQLFKTLSTNRLSKTSAITDQCKFEYVISLLKAIMLCKFSNKYVDTSIKNEYDSLMFLIGYNDHDKLLFFRKNTMI